MTRQIARLAAAWAVGLVGLSGCSTGARFVTTTSAAGVIAIPSNSNDWPNYYRKQAEELMQAKCPGGFVIEGEEQFINGFAQHGSSTDKGTSIFDHAEWRIYYRRTDAPPESTAALKVQPPPQVQPLALPQAAGLAPVLMPTPTMPGFTASPSLAASRAGFVPPLGVGPTGN